MTTLAGITACDSNNNGKNKGVVLASDLSVTNTEIGRKYETRKLFVDKSRNFAVCVAGIYDAPLEYFLSNMIEGKINIEEALKKGFFKKFRELNISRMGYKEWDDKKTNAMLIAARFGNKPKLYTCWSLGKIEERGWTCVGSGSEFADKYIEGQDFNFYESGVDKAVDLVYHAIKRANNDLCTSGFDLVTVREDGITEYHDKIKSNLESAEKSTLLSIIEENKR
jgi:20S proteasome alpha/beta subunit